jgi:hypothetical protein
MRRPVGLERNHRTRCEQLIAGQRSPNRNHRATFTVERNEQCSAATLNLDGVIAQAPTGQQVPLGTITIINTAWQWWHPTECHLVEATTGS